MPAADLVVAVATALLLWPSGGASAPPGAGEVAALVFLFLGDPALGPARRRARARPVRGVHRPGVHGRPAPAAPRARRADDSASRRSASRPGRCSACAFVYKYNAGAVLIAAMLAALWWWRRDDASTLLAARARAAAGRRRGGVGLRHGRRHDAGDLRLAGALRRPVSRDHQLQRLLLGRDLRQPLRDARLPAALPDRARARRWPVVRRRPRLRGDPRDRAGAADASRHAGPPAGAVGGGRVPVDRGQRQPRPAAVLPAGRAGPRAGVRRRRGVGAGRGCGQPWRAARRRRSSSSPSSASSTSTRSSTTCAGT